MCFHISTKHPLVKIAKKDIKCYKELTVRGKDYISPYRRTFYFSKNHKKVTIEIEQFGSSGVASIHKGLHVYSCKEEALTSRSSTFSMIFESIIPKGTPYYYNPDDKHYVTLKLIVFNKIVKRKKKNK